MSWNYRVVRHKLKRSGGKVAYHYAIHEAYYDKNGFVGMITLDPKASFGDTVLDLIKCHKFMMEAFKAPILDADNIPEPGWKASKDPIHSSIKKSKKKKKLVKYTPPDDFDIDAYYKEEEARRLKDEEKYNKKIRKLRK